MNTIDNNAYEVDPSPRKKRKRTMQCTNAFMNPALDILSTDDRMCNNIMEIVPAKRSRRSRSCDIKISFENPSMEKNYANDLLRKELANVNMKLASILEIRSPIYQNDSFNQVTIEEKTVKRLKFEEFSQSYVNSTPVVGVQPKRRASIDLSFIDKIGLNDDSANSEALYLDDDLNESNIMEIKTIDSKKLIKSPVILKSTNPFLNCQIDYDIPDDVPQVFTKDNVVSNDFPFDIPVEKNESKVDDGSHTSESSYNASSEVEVTSITSLDDAVLPRRLFPDNTSETSIQYMDDSSVLHEVPKFGHSTLNEHINTNFTKDSRKDNSVYVFSGDNAKKQSKILGCDVSQLSHKEIFNCQPNVVNSKFVSIPNVNNNIQAIFKDNSQRFDLKRSADKPKNSKTLFNKIRQVFNKHDKKSVPKMDTTIGNPYEVFRKAPVQEKSKKPLPVCFVNPALNLNNTDSEMDETDTTDCNTRNKFQLTPMKRMQEGLYEKENIYSQNSGVDLSDLVQTENTIKKHVRFDSTLNHEKYITGNSFDSENHSVGSSASSGHITQVLHQIDDQIDDFHNELDNCFNEKRIISQNL